MRGWMMAAAIVSLAGPAVAQEAPSATDLRAGLAGSWSGALGYRDYQSN